MNFRVPATSSSHEYCSAKYLIQMQVSVVMCCSTNLPAIVLRSERRRKSAASISFSAISCPQNVRHLRLGYRVKPNNSFITLFHVAAEKLFKEWTRHRKYISVNLEFLSIFYNQSYVARDFLMCIKSIHASLSKWNQVR